MTSKCNVQNVWHIYHRICLGPSADFVDHAGCNFPGKIVPISQISPTPYEFLASVWVVTTSFAWLNMTNRLLFNCCGCYCWCSKRICFPCLPMFYTQFSFLIAYSHASCGDLVCDKSSSAIFPLDMWDKNVSRTHSSSRSTTPAREPNSTMSAGSCSSVSFLRCFQQLNLYG